MQSLVRAIANIVQSSKSRDELFYTICAIYVTISAATIPLLWPIIGNTHKLLYVALFTGMFVTVSILWRRVNIGALFSERRKKISIIVTPIFFIVFLLFFVITMSSASFELVDLICLAGSGASVIGGALIRTSKK